jgi:hypothetical protein
MARALASLLLGLAVCAWINCAAVAASEPCKDCKADTGLTIREEIKAARARDVERMAKESAGRPWDGKDIGQGKRPLPDPAIR